VKNVAIFASGRGSNFIKINENIQKGDIPAQIVCLITDNSVAKAIEYAEENLISTLVISPKDFNSPLDYGNEILKVLNKNEVEWVVLAGFLKKIPDNVVEAFSNKILNIHPALLPAFGGKGMYGLRVHEAVMQSGTKVSGVTVHLVNNEYDAGPIVMQRAVDIEECRTPEEIAHKVLKTEHVIYSEALKRVLTESFVIKSNRVFFE
jgi:phosphoribosylglycinamide formyltransferase-1